MSRSFNLRRLLLVAAAIAVIVAAVVLFRSSGSDSDDGAALDTESAGGGAGGPVVPGEPLSFGIVTTRNLSSDPVQLVDARLLWLDPGLKLLGFTANTGTATGGVPLTAREWPVGNGVPLDRFPPLSPNASGDQVTITFGLTVDPDREGKALGVVVRYRQNGKIKEQLFKQQAFVCAVPMLDADTKCPGHGDDFDVAKDFDEELKARRRG